MCKTIENYKICKHRQPTNTKKKKTTQYLHVWFSIYEAWILLHATLKYHSNEFLQQQQQQNELKWILQCTCT